MVEEAARMPPGRLEGSPRSPLARAIAGRPGLWAAFVVVHVGLVLIGLHAPGAVFNDVTVVYTAWMQRAADGAGIVGIDVAWVYPGLALVPMAAAFALGAEWMPALWFAIVIALDGLAFAILLGWRGPSRTRGLAAWWWLAFLALLGPVALGRIDAITAPIAIVALLWAAGRPRVSAALLAAAMWIKVWPAALGFALVTASRRRVEVVLVALVVSATVLAGSVLAGGTWAVFGFLGEQGARGLQVESPAAVPWLWAIVAGSREVRVAFDTRIVTWQVHGPGVDAVASALTPLMAVLLVAVLAVGVVAVRRGAAFGALMPPLSLALVSVLLVANKVGSPQFVTWLAAPIVLGLCIRTARFAPPALLVAAIAGFTQVLYPYLYDRLLVADPAFVLVLTTKALLELAVLAWSVHAVWKSGARRREVA
ncbi:membrane protein [Agromyces rhizosphaerae]|uniref:Membrane protein n=1 Tax=Agromyces rhizosphaerae TaxID=88374 RepID=A0A9W6CTZ4_9MICO|nr:hypothetical protein [Agromyces rhizosphaerae]GLI26031.1 membrane protein [Agromyces rhizosphaerae]